MSRNWVYIFIGVSLFLTIFISLGYTRNAPAKKIQVDAWVYEIMNFMDQEGLVNNYPIDWVNSGNTLSRFEIAYYIKQIIVEHLQLKKEDLPTKSVELLQKLIAEFREELADLGVKITDIYGISPNLVNSETSPDEYQDLDSFLPKGKENQIQPYYYFGQYYLEFRRKTFIFVPATYVNPSELNLFEGVTNKINVLYQPQQEKNPSFLVVKGNLPVNGEQNITGYFLFPIEENFLELTKGQTIPKIGINVSILNMLDEVSKIQQIESLWRFYGSLSLNGYTRMETDFQTKPLLGGLEQSLKIGGFLIYTENHSTKTSFELSNFGLPFFNPPQSPPSTAVDLDIIDGKNLQSLQINIKGSMTLSPQTSLYGGLDILYRGMNTGLENLWPSTTKASGGVEYHLNDYWTFLTCQSFANSQQISGLLSTTSFGVTYNDWVTLWLAYQLLNFDNPVVTGALAFRF